MFCAGLGPLSVSCSPSDLFPVAFPSRRGFVYFLHLYPALLPEGRSKPLTNPKATLSYKRKNNLKGTTGIAGRSSLRKITYEGTRTGFPACPTISHGSRAETPDYGLWARTGSFPHCERRRLFHRAAAPFSRDQSEGTLWAFVSMALRPRSLCSTDTNAQRVPPSQSEWSNRTIHTTADRESFPRAQRPAVWGRLL